MPYKIPNFEHFLRAGAFCQSQQAIGSNIIEQRRHLLEAENHGFDPRKPYQPYP